MKALIDGDILTYSCGFASDKREKQEDGTILVTHEPLEYNLHSVKQLINRIMVATKADSKQIYLTGKDNYRDKLATIRPYKGNRDKSHKPYWYKEIKEYLVKTYGAIEVDGREADDAIGCEQWLNIYGGHTSDNTVICSLDKDFNMIPGWHYNWRKDIVYDVQLKEANKFFYTQLLTGDATDNIVGCAGIGPKKAEKLLAGYDGTHLGVMYDIVARAYQRTYPEGNHLTIMKENAILLWIQREEGKTWIPPT